MVFTHPDGSAALAYIINDVFDLYDNNSLALALENKGCKDIYDVISMSDNDIDSLTYINTNNDIVTLQGVLKNKIRILQQYIMHIYCSNEPIGNDWESITAENFDIYRTSTYLIETPVQLDTEMKATLLLALFSYDISNDCKNKVSQDEVSNSATFVNVPHNDIELAVSDNHPPLESTHLKYSEYCNIATVENGSACLEMGSIQIENVNTEDNEIILQRFDLENSPVCAHDEIGFILLSKASCQLGNYYLGELIDFCATKPNIIQGNDKTLMSNVNGKMNLLKVKVHGMPRVNKLVNDMVVIETMIEPMVEPQLVIDRGRITSLHADGE
jgi:hypothetical protein